MPLYKLRVPFLISKSGARDDGSDFDEVMGVTLWVEDHVEHVICARDADDALAKARSTMCRLIDLATGNEGRRLRDVDD